MRTMTDTNKNIEEDMGDSISNRIDSIPRNNLATELKSSHGAESSGCGCGGNENDRPMPETPGLNDELLDAALAVISSSTSLFSRAEKIAPLQQPSLLERKVTIHLVRHAEGPHNLDSVPVKERINMLDPGITPAGLAQCLLLSKRSHAMDKVTHILCSPLRRTIHTAFVGFKPAIERGVQVELHPDLRECGGGRCNTGTNVEGLLEDLFAIEKDVRRDCVDTTRCEPGWETGTESWEKKDLRVQRAARVESMLYHLGKMAASTSDDDVEIVVVTHSRLIMILEERIDENYGYHNAEYRSFRLSTDEEVAAGVRKFKLIETEESKRYVHTFPADLDVN